MFKNAFEYIYHWKSDFKEVAVSANLNWTEFMRRQVVSIESYTFSTTSGPQFDHLSHFDVIVGSEHIEDDIVAANTACNARAFDPEYGLTEAVIDVKRREYKRAVLSHISDETTPRGLHFHLLFSILFNIHSKDEDTPEDSRKRDTNRIWRDVSDEALVVFDCP